VVSYEEPVTTIREQLAATLEREEDWAKAAQVLAGIDLDSGVCSSCQTVPRARYVQRDVRLARCVEVRAWYSSIGRSMKPGVWTV
jgi:COP9 signalosome complex subunit 4